MKVKVTIERITVDEAEVELELPDGVNLDDVDWSQVIYRQMVTRPEGGEPPQADWELQSEDFDVAQGSEPEVLP